MSTYTALIALSSLVIFSYLFDLLSKRIRVPSVILLLFSGIGLAQLASYFGLAELNFFQILPALGTVGLILIVFEGSLELKYSRKKNVLIRKAFLSALFILLLTALTVALIMQYLTGADFQACVVNAIPFSIISSAIAIPSAGNIHKDKKEFVVYESSFSDILGIIMFDFAVANSKLAFSSFVVLGSEIITVLLISVLFSLLLLYIMGRLKHHIKFFLIIAILILVYASSHLLHLSPLILVLVFGLFLANAGSIPFGLFQRKFIYPKFKEDFIQLFQLSRESAFLLKTFFFLIFGFGIQLEELGSIDMLIYGSIILGVIYVIRGLYLKFVIRLELIPELFLTPRGLISILLFFSIPANLKIPGVSTALLFFIVLATSVVMTLGLVFTSHTEALEEVIDE
ncbi:MAG: hypothetical protein Q7J34_08865 [Bacteroidales bacterium]|nr:hypothetical protein [Bacteroidales bacterium]